MVGGRESRQTGGRAAREWPGCAGDDLGQMQWQPLVAPLLACVPISQQLPPPTGSPLWSLALSSREWPHPEMPGRQESLPGATADQHGSDTQPAASLNTAHWKF